MDGKSDTGSLESMVCQNSDVNPESVPTTLVGRAVRNS